MSFHRHAAVLAGIALLAVPLAAKEKGPALAPWSLAVEVRWGSEAGPDAFRAEVERAISTALGSAGCVASVDPGLEAVRNGASDLMLVATLHGFNEEVRFDDSLAVAATPGEPTKELRRVAVVEVDNELQLLTRAGGREVASKSFHIAVHHRPVYLGEDPEDAARVLALERIVQETRRALCKSGGKLADRVREEIGAR